MTTPISFPRPALRPRCCCAALVLLLLLPAALPAAGPAGGPGGGEDGDSTVVVRRIARAKVPCRLRMLGADGEVVVSRSTGGYLGTELTPLTPELRRHFGVPDDAGVMVGRVEEDSPAAAAGLEVGDILSRVDGEDIRSGGQLARVVRRGEAGDVVEIGYWRGGRKETVAVTLAERDRCAFDLGPLLELEDLDLGDLEDLGVELGDLGLDLSGEALDGVAVTLREILEDGDLELKLRELGEIDLSGLEERMKDLKNRLRELEDELEDESLRFGVDD